MTKVKFAQVSTGAKVFSSIKINILRVYWNFSLTLVLPLEQEIWDQVRWVRAGDFTQWSCPQSQEQSVSPELFHLCDV